jgi:hypothetical protein
VAALEEGVQVLVLTSVSRRFGAVCSLQRSRIAFRFEAGVDTRRHAFASRSLCTFSVVRYY